jgi:hypothetical protein
MLARSRRRSATAALAALAGMLFLQVTIAFAACELPDGSAGMTLAISQSDMPDCHERQSDANLCAAHCGSQDQTLAKAQFEFNVPDLAVRSAMRIRLVHAEAPRDMLVRTAPLAAAGPPARVLFQSFLL